MVIDRRGLRAVTWLADAAGDVAEVHVLASPRGVVTVWSGDPGALTEARAHFADRAAELNKSRFQAAAIVLQLLLGTLDQAISRLDTTIHEVREQLRPSAAAVEFTTASQRLQTLQSRWADFDRYSSSVRSAMVGVEAVSGMDPRGAEELNDYAEQVEDIEHRLSDRSKWGSNILQDYVAAIAQRQGDQINRLTLVSLIFPSPHVHHRLLRHELRLDERSHRERARIRRAGSGAACRERRRDDGVAPATGADLSVAP